MNARRIRDVVPGLGPLSRTGAAQSVIRGARRWRVLSSPSAFAANEILGARGRVVAHELVRGGTTVLRHRTRDVDIFDEILVGGAYAVPPEADDRLATIASPRILDLGANVGLFALYALQRYPSAQITSVEADPENLPILRACIARNPDARWAVIAAAAGVAEGSLRFEAGRFADSRVSDRGAVRVPSVDIFDLLAEADMVKIDIEGSEWPILLDHRFPALSVPVVVMESHANQAPSGGEPQVLARRLLERAGYTTCGCEGRSHGCTWAWK